MAFDPVPYSIGGGAEHSDEVFRVLASMATNGAQGVQLPGHLKVEPYSADQLVIRAGNVVIPNVQQAGESYVGRVATDTPVDIAPNGTGATRYDLILARVRDPDFSPWEPYTDPTEIKYGPYFEPHVESGVPAGTADASEVVSYSAYAPALVAVPAGGNAASATITDLRKLAQPRYWSEYDLQRPPATDLLTTAETEWMSWPVNSFGVAIPPWATHALATITVIGIMVDNAASYAETRVKLGNLEGLSTYFDYNGNAGVASSTYWERHTHVTSAEFVIPTQYKGTTQTLRLAARRLSPELTGKLQVSPSAQVVFDCRFKELRV